MVISRVIYTGYMLSMSMLGSRDDSMMERVDCYHVSLCSGLVYYVSGVFR